jgi:hypothetical protein
MRIYQHTVCIHHQNHHHHQQPNVYVVYEVMTFFSITLYNTNIKTAIRSHTKTLIYPPHISQKEDTRSVPYAKRYKLSIIVNRKQCHAM